MIEMEFHVPLPHAIAWEYMTQNKHLEKWWGKGVSLEAHQDGNFLEPWIDSKGHKHLTMGRVTAFEDKARLQMDWQDPGWTKPTRVEIIFTKTPDGTKIYLQHSGWDIFDDKERQKKVDQHQAGWQNLMERYRRYCLGVEL